MSKKLYMIGIAGPSCSGKTELARRLAGLLSASAPAVISMDSYYRNLSALDPEERARCNFDVPEALDLGLLAQHLRILARGEGVDKPVYQFLTHTHAPQGERVEPGEFIIVEGLFALYWEEVRELLGTRVFIDVDDDVCLSRRLARDTRERGRSAESILAQYTETVRPMSERYILPTRRFADVVVSGEDAPEKAAAAVVAHVERSASRV